jgi:hypothetical protein
MTTWLVSSMDINLVEMRSSSLEAPLFNRGEVIADGVGLSAKTQEAKRVDFNSERLQDGR